MDGSRRGHPARGLRWTWEGCGLGAHARGISICALDGVTCVGFCGFIYPRVGMQPHSNARWGGHRGEVQSPEWLSAVQSPAQSAERDRAPRRPTPACATERSGVASGHSIHPNTQPDAVPTAWTASPI